MAQGELFPRQNLPDGFLYQPDFLSEAEHAEVLQAVKRENFHNFAFHGYRARRRSVEYGLEYDFAASQATATHAFPPFLMPVRERAAAFAGFAPDDLVAGMILEYPPEAPIGWHRDAPQFGTVVGISLLSPARMRLKPYQGDDKIISVILEPRSIYVLSGAARWQWQHSIAAVEQLRYSITFRTLRKSLRA